MTILTCHECIAIIDRDGKLVEFNSNFCKIMQFSSIHGVLLNEEAIINKNIFTLLEHQCSDQLEAYFELAKTKKKSKLRQEIQYQQYCLQIELTPIRLPVQGFIGCSFVVKDITAQKQLEITMKQLHQSNQELQTAQQEIIALNQKLQAENIRMTAELDLLRRMQQLILPKPEELKAVQDLEIAGFMEPADEVGGDYYDVLCHEGVVTIGIGDVTGHGLESGLLMVMAQTAVRTLKEIREVDPVVFLDTLNRTIYKNIQRMNTNKNLTLAVLNYAEGLFSLSGQHEETIVIRAGGKVERIDTIDLGFPIGLDDAIAEFIHHISVKLNPGEVLALCTDVYAEPSLSCALPLFRQLTIKSLIVVPICCQKQVNTVIILYQNIKQSDRYRQWTQEETELLQAVSSQVEIAIKQAKLLDRQKQHSQALAAAKHHAEVANLARGRVPRFSSQTIQRKRNF